MRAVKAAPQMTLEDLQVTEVDAPKPGPGEILVRLKAAALNHRDLFLVTRHPVQAPAILGSDGSGVIETPGEGVAGWQPGSEVVIYPALNWGEREDVYSDAFNILGAPRDGTLAELVSIPAENVYPKPAHLSFEEAAALPLAGVTAYRALFYRARLQAGERALIHGIGGGVALCALQFAKARGAQVMVTSRHDDKLERARALGADEGVNSASEDWVARARAWSAEGGVDVVLESIGGEFLSRSLEALRMGGRLVTFGRSLSTTATIDVGLVFWNHLDILGSTMGSPADFDDMLELVSQHAIKPVVDSVRPLEEVRAAFQRMADGQQFGKLVLKCDSPSG